MYEICAIAIQYTFSFDNQKIFYPNFYPTCVFIEMTVAYKIVDLQISNQNTPSIRGLCKNIWFRTKNEKHEEEHRTSVSAS